jgi:hypothetical protein
MPQQTRTAHICGARVIQPPWSPAGHANSLQRHQTRGLPSPRRSHAGQSQRLQDVRCIIAVFHQGVLSGQCAHRALVAWAKWTQKARQISSSLDSGLIMAWWLRWKTYSQRCTTVAAIASQMRSARMCWSALNQWQWAVRLTALKWHARDFMRSRLIRSAWQVRQSSALLAPHQLNSAQLSSARLHK